MRWYNEVLSKWDMHLDVEGSGCFFVWREVRFRGSFWQQEITSET